MLKKNSLIALLAFITSNLFAQNITGTWQGIMSNENLQINIIQDGNELCGYTSDVVIGDRSSRCKAYFKGVYNKKNHTWIIKGTSFIENYGGHVLMTLKLSQTDPGDYTYLRGAVSQDLFTVEPSNPVYMDYFWIRKVSEKPTEPGNDRNVCFEMPAKKNTPPPPPTPSKPPVSKPQPKKEKENTSPVKPNTNPEKNTDPSIPATTNTNNGKKTNPKEEEKKSTEEIITSKMKERSTNEITTIKVSEPEIELSLYDNGSIDGDTITIFYNGKIIKNKQVLSGEPIKVKLKLDENIKMHEITLFADNLGSIPPNTALIIVNAGSERYELKSRASLDENAVLRFEYVPK
ncbi:MAG: hypothetical protein FGM46_03185 [Ferruginibacter sp.]|nr:hypothetical protein [Ferruginibacter sp.]